MKKKKKMMRTFAESAELQGMQTIHFNIHVSAGEASSLCTKIASFNGLATPKLIDARFHFFFSRFIIDVVAVPQKKKPCAVWRCRVSHASLRLSLVLLACLLTVSFIMFWTWRLSFVKSFGEARRLFLSHMSTVLVLTDCLLGFLLSAIIIFILHKAASLRNFFRHLGRNFLFNELVRIQSPLFRLAKIVFAIVACNMIFLGVVIFVPFTLGRFIILHHVAAADLLKGFVARPSKLYDDVTTLTVGYMFVVFLYLGIIALIRYFKGQQPLNFGRVYGVAASIVETIPPLLRQLLVGIKLGAKVACYFGVFPFMCGWWLDVCTVSMFGETMSKRVEFLSVSPLASSLVHWAVGVLYVLKICICEEELLLKVLRHEALFFLYDPEDDDDDESFQFLIEETVHKFARDFLFDSVKYGSLIILLVFLPVKLAIIMAPSVFPLDISVSDPFTEIPAGLLLFTICTQFIIEHFRLWTTVKSLVRCWFTSVCLALGLTDLLLPRPEDKVGQDNGDGEPERAMDVLPATVDPSRSLVLAGNVEQSHSGYIFVLRAVLLLLAAWVTLLLFNTALIVVSVSLGRALFNAIPTLPITHGIKCNDLYAFVIGTYAFWTTISGTMYAIEHSKSERTSVLLNQIWRWCGVVFKSSVLVAIWIFIIPVLIGLVLELLVIVPMRVPVDETPVFLLYQDWALGFIFLKIWTTSIILLDDSWKAKFERVEEDGFSRLQGLWVLKEIVSPILMKLLTALCVPYVLAKGVFPMLRYPLVVNSAVYRFSWIGCLSASLFFSCAKRCHVWFINLHNSIRDDRYLVGRRLLNFEEAALAKQKSSASEDDGEGDGDT
uniref:E3 ubiquitin-protein ligase MARCHF6-like C-terminal domain-containing protein n=1 Tax=Brassica campestris TaxID=3711 RepID=M4F0K7_BRACM